MKININGLDLDELDDEPLPKMERIKRKPKIANHAKSEEKSDQNKLHNDNYIEKEKQ